MNNICVVLKHLLPMKITTNLLFFLSLCLFYSCNSDTKSYKLLEEAQKLTKNNPTNALVLLDSIQNPENMSKDGYMQYIVALVQSKYKTYQDVTNDTLIFEAQRYFDSKGNYEEAALAHFYAGGVYREKKMPDKSLESFLSASYFSQKSNIDLTFSAKISENIGALYFEQDMKDSSIVYYKKALGLYESTTKNDISILKVNNIIGRAFEDIGKLDSAYLYFHTALGLAKSLDNASFVSAASQNLGVISSEMKDFDKAIDYFKSALDIEATQPNQILKINISLLNIYTDKKDAISAKRYVDTLLMKLPYLELNYTLKELYSSLSNYYALVGDYKQALYYNELTTTSQIQIEKEESPAKMLSAEKNYSLNLKDRQDLEFKTKVFLFLLVGVGSFFIILFFMFLAWRNHKKDKAEIQFHIDNYNDLRQILLSKNDKYIQIEAEIKSMLEDD